jgi:hypothetical protein
MGLLGIAGGGGSLDCREGLEAFAAGDGEGARLVSASEASGAFGDVAAGALGGSQGFVSELGVADGGGLDPEQKLGSYVKRDEPVMGELEEVWVGRSCPPGAGLVTARSAGARRAPLSHDRPTQADDPVLGAGCGERGPERVRVEVREREREQEQEQERERKRERETCGAAEGIEC